ncbi:MAG: hypothetical protein KGY66_03685 [Candidatus Thermoplasmatota archaeon]|nr:hypothetical protein [Candidatus Thermoplasmatota archaeon]
MFENLKEKMTCGSVLLISILLVVSFVPMNSSAQAEAPEWEEGDEWAMGFEGDIQEMFSPAFDMVDENLDPEEEEDLEEVDYNVSGEIGYYQIYEVTEAGDDGYTMEIEAGGGVSVEGYFEATGEMEEEGTYNQSEDIPKETKTISMEGDLHYSIDIAGTVEFDENFAIENITNLEVKIEASGTFTAENIPDHEYDWENETETISYEDYDGSFSVDILVELEIDFEPALDFFNFPIEEGEEWTADSEITITGSYEGEIDAEGLPEEIEEGIEDEFDQELPIILEDLDTDDADGFDEGDIDLPPEGEDGNISIPLKCTGTDEVVLPDGTTTNVYVIEFAPIAGDIGEEPMIQEEQPRFKMMYSEDEGFMVQQEMSLPSEAGMYMTDTEMTMNSMEVDEARESKEEIQQEDEEEEDGIPGFTLTLLGLGIVMAVVIYYKKER